MDETRTDREKYLAAKAHVAALKGFYIHLIVQHADALLARNGRFVDAVTAMGDGDFSQAGRPYQLRLDV